MVLVGVFALTATAQAAVPAPAWKVAGVVGPTNLPPEQSEVQQLTVEAEGGNFSLSRPGNEGEGTPVTGAGHLTYAANSNEVTIVDGTYSIGEKITGSGIRAAPRPGTIIENCIPDCTTPGSKLILSLTTSQAKTNQAITIIRKELSGVTGVFFGPAGAYPGDELSATNLQPETMVTGVGPGTVMLSKAPILTGLMQFTATQRTGAMPYNAPSGTVQGALESVPLLGPGSVSVSGGPGGSAATPYAIAFGGALAKQDVPQLTASGEVGVSGEPLSGQRHFVTVSTIVPGGPGTGELAVYIANVGGAPSSSSEHITVTIGPLPTGIAVAGAAGGVGWTCTTVNPGEVTCSSAGVVPANRPASIIGIPIEVGPLAPSFSGAKVSISGGGAGLSGSDTTYAPITVSNQPSPFGLAAFWAGAFEADGQQSTQAGGHPFGYMTLVAFKTARSRNGRIVPAGDSKDVHVDLPPGFVGNPMITTKRCPQGLLPGGTESPSACEATEAAIGKFGAQTGIFGAGESFLLSNLMNDIPEHGSAAQFTALFAAPTISLLGSVRSSEDFGIRVSAPHLPSTYQKSYAGFTAVSGSPESGGGKAFFRNATACSEQARQIPVTGIEASSWQNGLVFDSASDPLPPVTGCDKLKLEPKFSFQPTSTKGSSGVGATAHLHIDQSGLTDPNKLATADLKQSVVTLPAGFSVNPSQANGLEACSEAQMGYLGNGPLPNPTRFNEAPVTCPDGSKLGTVEAKSPLLEEPLQGTIYLAEQEKNPFGSLIAIYLVFESPRFGVTLKLPGKVDTDPNTGQITATFDYVPQQPVEDFDLHFRGGGPRSEFATPEVCGTYATEASWTPWSAPESGPPTQTSDPFTVSDGCSSSPGTRPFNPSFEAGSVDPIAGAFSPLVIKVNRKDGEQELNRLDFKLPLGITAKLAGVPYCPESSIAAAGGKTGKEEQASPSCPFASQIGLVDAAAGVGSEPFHTGGKVYLAGPYKGAPLSAVVITPAVAGPFDLGNVVIRSPLYVDLETAQVTAKSDPIPTILRGIPLKLRSVTVQINRSGFMLNPTNCEAQTVSANLGSSNGATATPTNRYQVGSCKNLKYKPRLQLRLKGATKRSGHPALRAVVTAPQGAYANTASIQVGLPHSEFLDQGNLDKVCTQPQLKSQTCPERSVYGHVKVWTPLFDEPLSGNVYIGVGYGHKLPDLVTELNGQVRLLVHGRVDTTKHEGLRNTFEVVPDAPYSKIVFELKGGKKYGLLENSENLCKKKQFASARFVAQNGLVAQLRPKIANQCGKKKKHHKRHKQKHHKKGQDRSGKAKPQQR